VELESTPECVILAMSVSPKTTQENVAEILFAPLIGSLIESSRRLRGAMTSLIFQNTTVALSCLTMFWIIYSDNIDISAWTVFAIVTTFSCFAILASVGLQNAISRDWVVEITTPEELTTMNAWMRSIGKNLLEQII